MFYIRCVKKAKEPAKQSKRYPWIAVHRGGSLSLSDRQQLIGWARACVGHVLHLIDSEADCRIVEALGTAKEWESGLVPTGVCMKKSLAAHAVAREATDEVQCAIGRAAGQAVATAHMADHSLGGAYYALKATKLAGGDVAIEKEWQEEQLSLLPAPLQQLVRETWVEKKLDKRI